MLEKCKNKQTHLYSTIDFPSYERTVNHHSVDHDIYIYICILCMYIHIYIYGQVLTSVINQHFGLQPYQYHVYLAEPLLFTAQRRGPSVKSATRIVVLYTQRSQYQTRRIAAELLKQKGPKIQKKTKCSPELDIIIPSSSHYPMNDSYELAQYQVLSLCSQVIVGGFIR